MDRRNFLTIQKRNIPRSVTNIPPRTLSGLNPYNGPWTKNEVQHLLKRTLFGSTKSDLDFFSNMSMSLAVDTLINPTAALPSPPVNDYNSGTITDPSVPAGQTWVNNPTTDGTINSARRQSFKKWWMGLQINQDRSIREKMTLFWANHFSTETTDIGNAHWIYWHHAMLRQNALGNFKSLVKSVTVDAAMLRYLNGYLNTKTAPDENYGRELQELFTIGKDTPNLYTEDDVKKAAQVLTGWRVNNNSPDGFFDSTRHDTSNKQFSSFYNNTIIAGKTGTAGSSETDELLNMIFTKNEVALYVCRRIYRWFVYYVIDSATESNLIQPLADLFRNSNYDIKTVLSALFKSEHFYDVLNQGCQIKSPVDHVVSCLREFNVIFPNNYADAYGMWNYIKGWTSSMGQDLGDPPGVSGWPAYYQVPLFHEIWINSDTLPKRNRFTDTMINSGYTRNGKKIIIDAVAFTKTLANPGDPNALIDEVLEMIYRVPLSAATKQSIKQQILLSNQVQDYYWTNAWVAYMQDPANQNNFTTVNTRLKSLYQYLMNLAEYQLA